jgi:RimJ/RimL family protein N-acetyltransferase
MLAMGSGKYTFKRMIEIPHLTTDRLLMRAFKPDDFEAYAEMMGDAQVSQHLMDGRPLSRAEAWRQMAMFIGRRGIRNAGTTAGH